MTLKKTAQSKRSQPKPAKKPAQKSASSPDQYTKPDLRKHIKEQVLAGDKGGNPGQWSARKAQLVAAEYEREGGAYKHPRDEGQEHLHQWTEEHWQTSDSKPARRDGVTARYLPKKAWEQLSPEGTKATNRKKVEGSRKGQQYVPNTRAAAAARKSATHDSKPAAKHAKSPGPAGTGSSAAKPKSKSKQ